MRPSRAYSRGAPLVPSLAALVLLLPLHSAAKAPYLDYQPPIPQCSKISSEQTCRATEGCLAGYDKSKRFLCRNLVPCYSLETQAECERIHDCFWMGGCLSSCGQMLGGSCDSSRGCYTEKPWANVCGSDRSHVLKDNGVKLFCGTGNDRLMCYGRGKDVSWRGTWYEGAPIFYCKCDCDPYYYGANCQWKCSEGHSPDCKTCLSPNPSCAPCTVDYNCNGNAHSVELGDGFGGVGCRCKCKGKWEGATCSQCPAKYEGPACDRCALGRINYPTCTQCTSNLNCNGAAQKVESDTRREKCVCYCNEGVEGEQCERCKAGYIGHPSLGGCDKCTVQKHCSGNAGAVTADGTRTKCECTCTPPYSGDTCSTCSAAYTAQCSQCSPGFVGFPNCVRCTTTKDCNGHADSVTSDGFTCQCTCSNSWLPPDCSVCPPQYSSTCNGCADGYIGVYPSCERCTVDKHCSSHASGVTSRGLHSHCECQCTNSWSSSDCSTCLPPLDASQDCGGCLEGIDGYVGYPVCRQCTSHDDCLGRASSVKAEGNKCVCTCRNQWTGDKCETCPTDFAGQDCDRCAPGRIRYPACTPCGAVPCVHGTVAADSNQLACQCICKDRWQGPDCTICPSIYDQATCDECASSHSTNYPTCTSGCDVSKHCYPDRALGASKRGGMCACSCKNRWDAKTSCSTCPTPYAGDDCDTCMEGFVIEGGSASKPECRECTIVTDCNGHASSVTSDPTRKKCKCTCLSKWEGPNCSTCPEGFDSATGCKDCLEGYIGYPNCVRCDVGTHCNGNAVAVTSNPTKTSCTCTCRDGWTGDTCSLCPPEYSTKCNTCSGLRINFPACDACTSDTHCNGRAVGIFLRNEHACGCTCRNKYTGPTCATCPDKFAGADCNQCAVGRAGYPECHECTVQGNCSGHATAVTSAEDRCICKCSGRWTGNTCDECPYPYAGDGCDQCVEGHVDYPICLQCRVEKHCNARAFAVQATKNQTHCECLCNHPWEGVNCEVCPSAFRGEACDQCAVGHAGFPECKPCTCSGRNIGNTTDALQTKCTCNCTAPYAGESCERCEDGHVEYPLCTKCDVDDKCNSPNALCRCSCLAGWDDSTCTPTSTLLVVNPQPIVRQSIKSLSSAATGIASLAGPSGALGGSRLKALLSLCGTEDDVLDPEIAPLGLVIGSGRTAAYLGGLVGDLVLVLSTFLLHYGLVVLHACLSKRQASFTSIDHNPLLDGTPSSVSTRITDSAALLRFPYISGFVAIFMFHGVATCALKLIVFGEAWEKVIGVGAIVGYNVGFLTLVAWKVRKVRGSIRYHVKEEGHCLSRSLLGPGEWVSTDKDKVVNRWGVLFEMYSERWVRFLVVEATFLLVVTSVQVIEATEMEDCKVLAAALAGLFGLLGIFSVAAHPWASHFDSYGNGLIALLEAVAMVILAVAFDSGDREHPLFGTAESLLLGVTVVVIVKAIIDPLLLLFVEWSRRKIIQRAYDAWKTKRKSCAEPLTLDDAVEMTEEMEDHREQKELLVENDMADPLVDLTASTSTPKRLSQESHTTPPDDEDVYTVSLKADTIRQLARMKRQSLDKPPEGNGLTIVSPLAFQKTLSKQLSSKRASLSPSRLESSVASPPGSPMQLQRVGTGTRLGEASPLSSDKVSPILSSNGEKAAIPPFIFPPSGLSRSLAPSQGSPDLDEALQVNRSSSPVTML